MKQIIFEGIKHIREALQDSKKVLLVCDSSFPYLNIRDSIEGITIPVIKFSDFTPNPLYKDVCKGVELFNTEQCDTILAIGGGSSMDVAKCIKLYCRMSKESLFLDQDYKDTGVKLIAIPTTAGTGSESTRYAVIYYDSKKQSVTHDSIIPNIAILEPNVLKTLPLYQKKCTMLDALCQGIESWWSVNSTDESRKLSKEAIETIMEWWHEYIYENTDESARQIMCAANLAGQAICITQTTAPHAFSYKVTSLYGLPHGHAVAVCLPEIWEYMITRPLGSILYETFQDIAKSMGCSSPVKAINLFRQILFEMEMSNPVAVNRKEELEILATSVNPVRLKNNPVQVDKDAIFALYNIIVK